MSIRQGLLALILAFVSAAPAHAGWEQALAPRLAEIDAGSPAELGVYVKHLGEDLAFSHQAERLWYLASTIKVPLAVAVLQKVEEGELSLDRELTLQRSDYVDGAGDLLWHEPGTRFSIRTLLAKMLRNSDSTATDMLIRLLGEDELNRRIASFAGPEGFTPFTTILQVRYDAYGLLHPNVTELSNMDFIRLKAAAPGAPRFRALAEKLPAPADDLRYPSIEAAFERYYEQQLNSGTMAAFGKLLEDLVEGHLLSPAHTDLVLGHMEKITTGDRRIKAGLPRGLPFAQKTGTQIGRACNVGVIRPREPARAVVVSACVEKHESVAQAERLLAAVGRSLREAGVVE